jgi:hypothetical protein
LEILLENVHFENREEDVMRRLRCVTERQILRTADGCRGVREPGFVISGVDIPAVATMSENTCAAHVTSRLNNNNDR